jgi:uncharacterized membrane protein
MALNNNQRMWEAVRWLHLLAMAFFVGGQLVLAAAVVPAFRGAEGRDREPLRAIARRFGQGTLVAIGLLVVTGVAMAGHFGDWDRSTLQVKLGLVVLVGILVGLHIRSPTNHALDGAIFLVSLAIVWLGVALAH